MHQERKFWCPWAVRASSGHSIPWLDYRAIIAHIPEDLAIKIPTMVHATNFSSLNSILLHGLVPGREFCMFNMIPHVDPRSAKGQRFDDWNSPMFFDPSRIASGDPICPVLFTRRGTIALSGRAAFYCGQWVYTCPG